MRNPRLLIVLSTLIIFSYGFVSAAEFGVITSEQVKSTEKSVEKKEPEKANAKKSAEEDHKTKENLKEPTENINSVSGKTKQRREIIDPGDGL